MSGPDQVTSRLFVTSDPHGHLDELTEALVSAGLVTGHGDWAGGPARLCVLGDLFDRGPDGIGVVDLVMKLQSQAEDVHGHVTMVLGNHEVLALGTQRFGSANIGLDGTSRNFAASWLRNGGVRTDQARLTERHVDWLRALPAVVRVDDYLLMHSDTLEYVEWGESIDEINAEVHTILATDDPVKWWDLWWRLTTRYVYNGEDGAYQAQGMLDRLGGRLLVHGHSIVADLLDIESEKVDGPLLYAEDQVLAVDGGIYDGGPCLVVELPISAAAVMRKQPGEDSSRHAPTSS